MCWGWGMQLHTPKNDNLKNKLTINQSNEQTKNKTNKNKRTKQTNKKQNKTKTFWKAITNNFSYYILQGI